MERDKLGKLLFDFMETLFEGDGSSRMTAFEEKVLKPLEFEIFLDCAPFGYMGMKDTQTGKILEDCYSD